MLSLTDTTLGSGVSPLGTDVLRRLLQAVTLKPQPAAQSRIDCAVVRLPLKNGVATVDRSIALETDQLSVSAKGEVRLDDETLALAFRPTPKTGLNINPMNLAQLVVLKGPWQDPKLTLDAQGVAGMAASLGLAGATGGLSLLAQELLKAVPEKDVCRTALSGVAPSPAAPADTGLSAQVAAETAAGAARGAAQHLQVASGSAGASSRCSSWSSVSYTWASSSAPMCCSSSRYWASMRGTMRRASARLFGVIDTEHAALVLGHALALHQAHLLHARQHARGAGAEQLAALADLPRLQRRFVEQRAQHAPLLLGQAMLVEDGAEVRHHAFARAQQQQRQVATARGVGHGGAGG